MYAWCQMVGHLSLEVCIRFLDELSSISISIFAMPRYHIINLIMFFPQFHFDRFVKWTKSVSTDI